VTTTADPLALPHIVALLRTLDDDDAVLPVLADALEEQGDERAAGLRRLGNKAPARDGSALASGWFFRSVLLCPAFHYLAHYIHERVYDAIALQEVGGFKFAATRSAAYLALAAAIVEAQP
jgi:hypothetical protein